MAKNQVNKDPSTVGGDLEEFVRDEKNQMQGMRNYLNSA
jgi:hypothetical protein